MSVLLRQPHGFEGISLAHVELLVDHQTVLEGHDPRDLSEGHLDDGGAPAHPQVERHDHAVPCVDELVMPGNEAEAAELLDRYLSGEGRASV